MVAQVDPIGETSKGDVCEAILWPMTFEDGKLRRKAWQPRWSKASGSTFRVIQQYIHQDICENLQYLGVLAVYYRTTYDMLSPHT